MERRRHVILSPLASANTVSHCERTLVSVGVERVEESGPQELVHERNDFIDRNRPSPDSSHLPGTIVDD